MEKRLLGLLMPHPPCIVAGIGTNERVMASATVKACEEAAAIVADYQPDTLVLISPHGPMFKDAVALMVTPTLSGDFSRFGAPSVRLSVPVDLALAKAFLQEAQSTGLPVISLDAAQAKQYRVRPELDHGALVPLSYLMQQDKLTYPIIHLTYGLLPGNVLFEIGCAIRRAVERIGRRIVVIASGDLSHRLLASGPYGFDPAGPVLDRKIVDALSGNWADKQKQLAELFNLPAQTLESAAECGLRSLQILIGFMDRSMVFGTCLSYEGPFGVGYAVCVFQENTDQGMSDIPSLLPLINGESVHMKEEPVQKAHPYVCLARQSLTHYLHEGTPLQRPDDLSAESFNLRKACFVSIKKDDRLRGCIGTLQPFKASLAHEIISNAISAGLHDPRFSPVTSEELPGLRFSVDVLSAAEPATRAMLDPKKYGVIVRFGNRSGVLLPDLEGVETVDRQLAIALQKAGIRAEESYLIERFTVDRYEEHSP